MESYKSSLFSINWRDAFKAALTSMYASVGLSVGILAKRKWEAGIFDFTLMDVKLVLSMSLVIYFMRLTERFTTDEKGKIFGRY